MLELETMSITNFLCFEEAVVDFSKKGLISVLGDNKDATCADSNGAGKSSIFEALYWCLYGKTIKKMSSDSVVRKKALLLSPLSYACVNLHFKVRGDSYQLIRYRNHSTYKNGLFFRKYDGSGECVEIEGENKKETQEIVEQTIGMSASLFRQVVLFGQGGMAQFSQLTDTEKKKLFEEILQVDIYERATKQARANLKESQGK